MDRRQYLTSVGVGIAGALAGCPSDTASERPVETTTDAGTTADRPTPAGVSTTSSRSSVTVEWWSYYTEEADDRIERALRKAGLDDSITVELGAPPGRRLEQTIADERAYPTIAPRSGGRARRYAAEYGLEPLSSVLDASTVESIREGCFDRAIELASYDGTLYGLPLDVTPDQMLIYRRDLLSAAGYDPDAWREHPPTWDRFHEVVADVTARLPTPEIGFTFPARSEAVGGATLPVAFRSRGGAYFGDPSEHLYGPVGERPVTVDEQPVLEALRMYRRFVHGPDAEGTGDGGDYPAISPTDGMEWGPWESREAFEERSAVATLGYPSSLFGETNDQSGTTTGDGASLGIALPPYSITSEAAPYPETGGPRPGLYDSSMIVNPHAPPEKKQAAGEVLRAIRSDVFRLFGAEELGFIPPRPDLYGRPRFRRIDEIGSHADLLLRAIDRSVPPPVTRVWDDQWGQVRLRFQDALRPDGRPAEELASLQAHFERVEAGENE